MPMDNAYIDTTIRNIYDSIMKTKQQLQDLKASLEETLASIKNFTSMLNETERKAKQSDGLVFPSAELITLQQKVTIVCRKCSKQFPTKNDYLIHELFFHQVCDKCHSLYFQPNKDHEQHFCPQWKMPCPNCSTIYPRNAVDAHIKKCMFRKCPHCKHYCYIRSFAFHLTYCGKENVNPENKRNVQSENKRNVDPENKIQQNSTKHMDGNKLTAAVA